MKLFKENSSINTMNELLIAHIPNYSLIGDLEEERNQPHFH
ncbi:hypothetical protein [Lederbergia panacisoli]|nr:hypothetical protein [Lederbergia panacisoli]MCR2820040.1 hypothetical protein [Lederbergia panacisoli]